MKSSMLASVIASAGAAGTLKLAYQDCGASHGKVTGLSPSTLTLGQKTTVTGSGSVDEAVTDGTFEMNIKASILSKTCTGNICQPSTCPLPAGVGSITWNGMKCPLAKGDVTVGTDVMLSGALPPWAARATIGIKGKASNGDDLLCMTLSTAPAEAPIVIQQSHPSLALPEAESPDVSDGSLNGGTLKLAYQDCGATHGKVTGLSPNTLTLGRKTTVTGSGSVDEAVTAGTFEMNIKASILSKTCTGNICQPSTCPLPAGVGSITWNGMKCPLAKGDVTVGTDVILSGALPPWAARATIGIKGKASNGDDLLCMTLSTAPAEAPIVIQQSHPSLALPNGGTLKLAYQDCGASHGKVTGLSPNTLTLGQKTTVTGSGSVDEAVTDGTFEMNIKASILSKTCTGNICQPSTCPLPAGVGSITWKGMKCPLAKGDVTVGTDVMLSGALPPWAARATISIKGKASNGDGLLCMTLSTAPAEATIVV